MDLACPGGTWNPKPRCGPFEGVGMFWGLRVQRGPEVLTRWAVRPLGIRVDCEAIQAVPHEDSNSRASGHCMGHQWWSPILLAFHHHMCHCLNS